MTRSRGAVTTGSQTTGQAPGVPPSRRPRRVESPFVTLDRSRCTACWECIPVCPESVLGKIDVWLHRHAVVRAGDRCLGCRRCIKVCAAGALSDRGGSPSRELRRSLSLADETRHDIEIR
jgi:Fe-S-cluster-containing hydrogenase component 2